MHKQIKQYNSTSHEKRFVHELNIYLQAWLWYRHRRSLRNIQRVRPIEALFTLESNVTSSAERRGRWWRRLCSVWERGRVAGGGKNGWVGAIARRKDRFTFLEEWGELRAHASGHHRALASRVKVKRSASKIILKNWHFCEWTLSLSRIDDDQNFTIKPQITKRTF